MTQPPEPAPRHPHDRADEDERPIETVRTSIDQYGTPMTRIPLDHLTSDQLDTLYERLEQAELKAEAMTFAMKSTATDALKHRGCHMQLMAQCTRAERAEAELAALKSVTSGYCPECGRGDCSPTADQWYEQQQRAERAEATLTAVRALADEADRRGVTSGPPFTVAAVRAVLDQHGQTPS